MSQGKRVVIEKLRSGVPGLDVILGGGVPEGSFNLIAGAPGTGKTTLAHQFVFQNATPERTALFFTILGEPAAKMLRHQQQYTFFDPEQVDETIRFINLTDDAIERAVWKVPWSGSSKKWRRAARASSSSTRSVR